MLFKNVFAALAAARVVAAVPELSISGNSFVNAATGEKFQIVGMAYQPGGESGYKPAEGIDALSDGKRCRRDAALMQLLGINAIRSYNLSPDINHDECASIFNAAGIYMLLDVNAPGWGNSLNRDEPWTTYYDGYLNRTFAIVEAFKSYPNTLAFFSANEVINEAGTAVYVPPYLRAMSRDLKAYIAKNSDRHIPVGYSAADVRDVLADTYNYLICSSSTDDAAAEFFALNSYSWCGPEATFESSTYADLYAEFKSSPIPVFFSEFGCNVPQPRYFNEIQAILGPNMTSGFSGGIVYEWTQEDNNYGVIKVNDDESVQLLADYAVLLAQYNKLDVSTLESSAPGTPGSTPTCSTSLITESDFNSNFTLPALPDGAQDLIDNGISSAPVGKIIDISDYTVPYTVKDASGNVISGLAVQPLASDKFNMPGTVTNSGVSASSNSTSAAADNDSSASSLISTVTLVAAGAVPAFVVLLSMA